jgi:hypothetical protein
MSSRRRWGNGKAQCCTDANCDGAAFSALEFANAIVFSVGPEHRSHRRMTRLNKLAQFLKSGAGPGAASELIQSVMISPHWMSIVSR